MDADRKFSCHELHLFLHEPPKRVFKNTNGTIFVHGATRAEKKLIFGAIKAMTASMQKAIDSISVLSPSDSVRIHLGFLDGDPKTPIAAHCHRDQQGCICIKRQFLGATTIWHEAAHALTFHYGDDFIDEWKSLAGDVYGINRYPSGQTFPYVGVLTRYGSRNELEDIAELVERIYLAFTGHSSSPFAGLPQGDDLYLRKIGLLYKHDFFSSDALLYIKSLMP